MAYSGQYKLKKKNKYRGNADNIVYRSLWEKNCFSWCEKSSEVKSWSSEEVVIPYYYEVDKKGHKYYVDLLIIFEDRTILVEIKPKKETTPPEYKGRKTKRYITEGLTYIKNQNKWSAAAEYAKDRGWHFEIWTEETLTKMGILKPRLKPLKPLRVVKKK
jgi:hypothetical protein